MELVPSPPLLPPFPIPSSISLPSLCVPSLFWGPVTQIQLKVWECCELPQQVRAKPCRQTFSDVSNYVRVPIDVFWLIIMLPMIALLQKNSDNQPGMLECCMIFV